MDRKIQARVIWHRRDLRLIDNILYQTDPAIPVIPLYIFDPKEFDPRPSVTDAKHNVAKVGPFAFRFLFESVESLRCSLQELSCNLFVRSGEPHHVVPRFLQELLAAGLQGNIEVVWHDEAGTDEAAEAAAVRSAVDEMSRGLDRPACISCSSYWEATMWHPLDLTIYKQSHKKIMGQEVDISCQAWHEIKQLGVQSFRRRAKCSPIRQPEPAPTSLAQLPVTTITPGDLPCFSDLLKPTELFGLTVEETSKVMDLAQQGVDPRSAHPLRGGEKSGIDHLQSFVKGPAEFCNREGGGNADVGVDSSAKMSAYLAFGCLSPRTIHAVCKARQDGKAAWLPENMEMRDFWIFYALAHGKHLFERDGRGPANLPPEHWMPHNPAIWKRWLQGTTGLPLLDATMKELQLTGYTSNRCRQIPVSVLANDLQLDWRSGAELYQWLLVDHDVGPNWGNWRYFSGTGCDPKRRHYKAISQGLRYDSQASFIKTWLPQLEKLSSREAHLIPVKRVRSLAADEIEWPAAIVDPVKQMSWDDQKSLGRIAHNEPSADSSHAYDGNGLGKDVQKGKGRGKGKVSSKGESSPPSRFTSYYGSTSHCDSRGSASRVRRWHAKAAA
jgi:deoxyribodipyrimidine photo-lyase